MSQSEKVQVVHDGVCHTITILGHFHLSADELLIRQDPASGDIILSSVQAPTPASWDEIFAAIDAAGFPEDFMMDREQGIQPERDLW